MKYGNSLRFLMILSLAAATGTQALAAPELLTIRKAMDIAMQNNPDVRNAKEQLSQVNAQLSLAVSGVLPQVNGLLTANTKQDAANSPAALFNGTPYNLYSVQLSASQILFNGDPLFLHAIGYAKKQIEISNYNVEIAVRNLTQNVIQAFYTILLNKRNLMDLEKTQKVDQEVLVTAEYRYKIGRGQLLDVLTIKTTLALLDPQIAQARTLIENSAAQLVSYLADPHIQDIEVAGKLDLPGWDNLINKIRDTKFQRPELAQNLKTQDQFRDQRAVTLAPNYPQLSAVASWGQQANASSQLFNTFGSAWSVGLQLQIPIFSGLSYWNERSVLASEQAQLEIAEASLLTTENFQQVQAQKNLDLATRQISASTLAQDLAGQSLAEARRQYKLATIDYLQFLTAQTNLLQADITLDQNKFNALVALTAYFVAYGFTMDDLVTFLAAAPTSTQ